MFILPDALAALGGFRQFIVFRLVPSSLRPGKTDKFPIDYRTGDVVNAHDPAIWLGWEEAAAYAVQLGADHGVGFVFTANDPFFFIDIDSCLEGTEWSGAAQALLQRFQGAAVEISASGSGLHIIGCGVAPEPRRIKYGKWFDLYTKDRFVALTGTGAIGNVWTDHTPALGQLVIDYLTPDPNAQAAEWTNGPCPEWRGPEDDATLIARAMRSTSAASAFGGTRASFADLWTADARVLGAAYPDPQRAYDASSADAALAQHLAFWTGKDCDRIERLMRQSALVREKWSREDYMQRTIIGAVSRQIDVLKDKPREEAAALPPAPPTAPMAKTVTGTTYLSAVEQVAMFMGCVYVRDVHRVLVPGGHLLKPDQFKVMFGGYSFPMDPANERVSRNAWEAFTESQCYRAPRADTVCFRPERPPGEVIEESGVKLANLWWPIDTPRAEGDAGPFLQHIAKLLPNLDDQVKLIAYLAAIVQYPGVKFQWAPLIQGVKGNGKTLILTAVTHCVGDRYSHLPNTKDLADNGLKFTGWLQGKLFIGLEEIYTADRRELAEALKPLITNTRIEIQGKGQDQVTGDNRANLIALSNHKDAVPKTNDERRWAVFFTAQQRVEDLERDGMHGDYFPDLWNWFHGREKFEGQAPGSAIINNFLRTYKIPDALNPALQSHRAPDTSTTNEAIHLSVGAIEQEILEAIEEGRPGFANGWVSSIMLDRLLARIKADRRIPPRKRRDILVGMGYDWHPHLPEGRVMTPVQPDGGKPKLFIKKGHIYQNLTDGKAIAHKYSADQQTALAATANFGVDGSVNKV